MKGRPQNWLLEQATWARTRRRRPATLRVGLAAQISSHRADLIYSPAEIISTVSPNPPFEASKRSTWKQDLLTTSLEKDVHPSCPLVGVAACCFLQWRMIKWHGRWLETHGHQKWVIQLLFEFWGNREPNGRRCEESHTSLWWIEGFRGNLESIWGAGQIENEKTLSSQMSAIFTLVVLLAISS